MNQVPERESVENQRVAATFGSAPAHPVLPNEPLRVAQKAPQ